MKSVFQISLLATLLAASYGQYRFFRWFRRYSIQDFMTPGARIWFYATSISSGQSMCTRDNVHNATREGVAFYRTFVNRTIFEQDFYVQQMYGSSVNPTTMVVRKTSGIPQDISVERMIYTNPSTNCAVFYVESLEELGKHWCDLRVKHEGIRGWIPLGCRWAFYRYPCYGWKRQLFTDVCRI